jgi:FkbM family methyltransferase
MNDLYENRSGWIWPKADVGAWAAVFFTLPDLDMAIRLCKTNYGALIRNVPEPNVVKHRAALGEIDGALMMVNEYSADNYGAKFVTPIVATSASAPSIFAPEAAPTMVIDELALPALDLLVLDIEGYETAALRGSRDSILRFKPVVMFEDKHAERYGFQRPEDYLSTLNYKVVARVHRDVIMVPV